MKRTIILFILLSVYTFVSCQQSERTIDNAITVDSIHTKKAFMQSVSDTANSRDLQFMPKRWILDRFSTVTLANNIFEWDATGNYYRPYDTYAEIGSNAYFYSQDVRPTGTNIININALFKASNFYTNNNDNTAIGIQALQLLSSGLHNLGLGTNALQYNTTGSDNVSIGVAALQNANATGNTAIGYVSLRQNSSGNYNTALGNGAGHSVTGSSNVFIGYNAAYNETSISNRLYIANSNTANPLIYGEFDNSLIRINGNTQTRHILGLTSAPSITTGTGAGTSPTISITGTDLAGRIVLTTGTTPTAGTLIVQTTFNINYGAAPYVTLTPGNYAAAAYSAWYVNTFTNMFTLYGAAGALTEATEYIWFYHVIQ